MRPCGLALSAPTVYVEIMTVEAIKHALEELSDPDRYEVAHWLEAMQERSWDCQMERDFVPGGPAQSLFDELSREIDEGNTMSMEEACREQRRAGLK